MLDQLPPFATALRRLARSASRAQAGWVSCRQCGMGRERAAPGRSGMGKGLATEAAKPARTQDRAATAFVTLGQSTETGGDGLLNGIEPMRSEARRGWK